MTERKLVTVERIAGLAPIEGADAIVAATIRGWTVVVKKGEFEIGEDVVYFEIDSFLPTDDERFAFLAKRGSKTVDGTTGHVLKTARLRGVYSQGLALPIRDFPELVGAGGELAERLGVTKYEPPIPASLAGEIVGAYPTSIPKTDAERVQNLADVFPSLHSKYSWIATEKIDGTSTTFLNDGTLRVCGRNWEFARPLRVAESTQWRIAEELHILDRLPKGYAVQGELFGPGVQGNTLKMKSQRFAAFSVLRDGVYLARDAWPDGLAEIAVPVLDKELPDTVTAAISQADGLKSAITPTSLAEGIVWHSGTDVPELGRRRCFKVVNNRWLVKAP